MDLELKILNKLSDLQKLAASKKGFCISDKYNGSKSKLEWQCEFGHKWKASPNSIMYSNTWCPKCAGNLKLNLVFIKQIAKSKGGKFLSTEYHNSKEKMLWECENGHKWFASTFSVRTRDSWCPECFKLKTKKS